MSLLHVALISFREKARMLQKLEVYQRYQTLADDCGGEEAGILFFKVDYNLDTRKKVHLVQVSVFRDDDALQAYCEHPKHVEVTNILREIADWTVGDIPHPANPF